MAEGQLQVFALEGADLLGGKKVWQRINTEELRENLDDLLSNLRVALPADSPTDKGRFEIKTIQVAVKVGAKGQVGILGTGVEASGEASLTLTLERRT